MTVSVSLTMQTILPPSITGARARPNLSNSRFLLQPFVNYNLPPIITANWKADSARKYEFDPGELNRKPLFHVHRPGQAASKLDRGCVQLPETR